MNRVDVLWRFTSFRLSRRIASLIRLFLFMESDDMSKMRLENELNE